MVKDNIYVILVTATKLDDTFPICQSCIDGCSNPYRLGRNSHGGGILLYISPAWHGRFWASKTQGWGFFGSPS